MDKSKQAKLVALRKKKAAAKKQSESTKHSELLNAIKDLHSLFGDSKSENADYTDKLLEKLTELNSFKNEIIEVKNAIEALPQVENVTISNVAELVDAQKELDLTEVTSAIQKLSEAVEEQSVDTVTIKNKDADDYIPVRRVRQVGNRLVFDDEPLQVNVVGGGSTIAGVQEPLIRNGDSIAVVNPDGTPVLDGTITVEPTTLADFSVNDLDDSTSTEYYGFTKPDGTYLVKQLTDTVLGYATIANNGGVADYATAWSNKLTLIYGRFDEAF